MTIFTDRVAVLLFLLRVTDVLCVFLSGSIAYFFYLYTFKQFQMLLAEQYIAVIMVGTISVAIIFHLSPLYSPQHLPHLWLNVRRIVAYFSLLIGVLLVLGFMTKTSAAYSRGWFILWYFISISLLTSARLGATICFKSWTHQGTVRIKTVIVGADKLGATVGSMLTNHPTPSFDLLGYFDDRINRLKNSKSQLPILGTVQELIQYGRQNSLDLIIIALPWSAEERITQLIDKLKVLPVDLLLAPEGIGLRLKNPKYHVASGIGLLLAHSKTISGSKVFLKAAEDKIIALLAIIFALPLMAVIWVIIKIESRGPVLFRQPRHGFNEKTFYVLKFRTMYIQYCDIMGDELVKKNDQRVTRIGRFLRRSSIDELPQLFNVLRGEMSLVGPRPHPLHAKVGNKQYDEVVRYYARRCCVKPGITGLAQIRGWRGPTETEFQIRTRVDNDLFYIENWSLGLDLKILALTIPVVFGMKNAF